VGKGGLPVTKKDETTETISNTHFFVLAGFSLLFWVAPAWQVGFLWEGGYVSF
jgi:hypothetical protein